MYMRIYKPLYIYVSLFLDNIRRITVRIKAAAVCPCYLPMLLTVV